MVSFIILNYKTKHLLRLAIKNILSLHLSIPYEIIVVDNASQDGSVEMMEQLYPDVQVISKVANTGHADGNNVGLQAARGEYCIIMNSDIIFLEAKNILELIQYLSSNPDIGLIGPKLRNADGTIQASCFRPYAWATPLFRRTPLGKLPSAQRDLQRHLMTDFAHDAIREVDWLLGACMIIPRRIIEEVGPLNNQFFLYFADYEWCDRIRAHGYKVIYYPDVTIVHYHRRESAQRSIWGGLGSIFNYVTRIHIKDWLTYLRIKKQGYDINSRSTVQKSITTKNSAA